MSSFQLPRFYSSPTRVAVESTQITPERAAQSTRVRVVPPTQTQLQWAAILAKTAPRVPWDVFIRDHFQWDTKKEGEHIALIGPTGQGKTVLSRNLSVLQPFVSVFGTKPRDDSLDYYVHNLGYVRLSHWRNGLDPLQFPRRVIWPDIHKLQNMVPEQKHVFTDALQGIYLEGNWTVMLDEYWYMVNVLKMETDLVTFLTQARSLGISMVMSMQRPREVPVSSYSQSTHLFFWRNNDGYEVARLAEIGGGDAKVVGRIVATLERYQVLYVNTRTGAMIRTKAPAP